MLKEIIKREVGRTGITQEPVSANSGTQDEVRCFCEAAYRSLLRDAPFAVCHIRADGTRILSANRTLVELLGYDTEGELLQVPCCRIFVKPEESACLGEQTDTAQLFRSEVEWVRKDGRRVWVRLASRRLEALESMSRVVEMTVEDITERSQMQAALQQAQRMEAVGQLASGIAHDFNNALMIVSSFAETMAEDFPAGHPQHKNAMQILTATRGATRLARQLLTFSRKHVPSPTVFDLSKLVSGIAQMLCRPLGVQVELVVIPNPQKGVVRADPGQIEQILINLAVNACDAMPEGGKLTLQTENVELDSEFVMKHPGSRQGSFVVMSVTDTGYGMDESTQARIFEPFFTTKQTGIGLGLATVYGIMKQSGGYISVESTPRSGTTFRCYLPCFNQMGVSKPTPTSRRVLQKGTESVLLVEDDGSLRELVRDFLSELGYQVRTASSGKEARELIEKTLGPIHLMVTGLVIPRTSGDQVVASLPQWHPETRVIYLSAFAEQKIGHRLTHGGRLLRKPFELPVLAEIIRDVLDSPSYKT